MSIASDGWAQKWPEARNVAPAIMIKSITLCVRD